MAHELVDPAEIISLFEGVGRNPLSGFSVRHLLIPES